jgi:hypothetical protein
MQNQDSKDQSGDQPGPFELREFVEVRVPYGTAVGAESASSAVVEPVAEEGSADDDSSYVRNLDCANYETCLNLAAALNWETFTCTGCSGEVNQSLIWRAHHAAKKDSVAKKICRLHTRTLAVTSRRE